MAEGRETSKPVTIPSALVKRRDSFDTNYHQKATDLLMVKEVLRDVGGDLCRLWWVLTSSIQYELYFVKRLFIFWV